MRRGKPALRPPGQWFCGKEPERPRPYTMRKRPDAPLWPKGRPCAGGSWREESRKTRSPPSFRRGDPAGGVDATRDMRPDRKTRRGHAGRVADAGSKEAPAARAIAPPRPCVKTSGATFTQSPTMRPGRHPTTGRRPGCRAECDIEWVGTFPARFDICVPGDALGGALPDAAKASYTSRDIVFTGGGRSPADRRYAS